MAECKGLVKLFGKTILLVPPDEEVCCWDQPDHQEAKEDCIHSLLTAATPRDEEPPQSEENEQATASSTASNDQKPSTAPTSEQEAVTTKPSNLQPTDIATNSQSKPPLKKPDKILPCPRCSSLDTKFCYFNNYNVNQPRHFCKNCQRYWTDGGSMRNVPVGAGRRRSKNSAVSMETNKHITVSGNGLQTEAGPPHDVQRQQCRNGTMLCFKSETVNGADGSIAPVLKERITASSKMEEQRSPHSVGSSGVQSIPTESVNRIVQNSSDTPVQAPLNASSWGFNWNPPFPFYPNNYYPSVLYPVGQCWGIAPWISPGLPPLSSASSNTEVQPAEPPCSSLGKHSREEVHVKEKNINSANPSAKDSAQEKSLWMPKTLRITDPEEAAMSSIWLSIGIKKGKGEDTASGGMFKGFQSKAKSDTNISTLEISQHMNPNPAALSRSHNFHERLG